MNEFVHDDPLAFLAFQREHWHKEPGQFWHGLTNAWRLAMGARPHDAVMSGGFEWVAGILGGVAGVLTWVKVRPSYGAYVLASWIIMTTTSFWQSTPRYLLPLFPVFVILADVAREPLTRVTLAFASVSLYSLFLCRFVIGAWAF